MLLQFAQQLALGGSDEEPEAVAIGVYDGPRTSRLCGRL